jgi:N-acyl amino acid synthase of PEP-CTERM/exosortase system
MFDPGGANLRDMFRARFEIVPGVSSALRDQAFRIRHQVYCEDLGLEPRRPHGREFDEYDPHATQVLLRHIESGEFIGCARAVETDSRDPRFQLPFERACDEVLDRNLIDPGTLPREHIAEISRLAVIARYRHRKGEEKMPYGASEDDFGTDQQPRFPYILVGLYFGVATISLLHGIEYVFVLTEPRVAQHLLKIGVDIAPVGRPVEYLGSRVPSVIRLERLMDDMSPVVRPLFAEIQAQVQRAYEQHD